jgi:MFS-type transporter involved in bile tolerance (Atg22 family)
MVGISSVLKFGLAFWLLSVSCVSVYACVLPWNNIAQDFLLEKYLCPGGCQDVVPANPTTTAAEGTVKYAMSIPYVISGAASPFLGGLVDKCGHRVILTTLSAAALVAVHLGFAFAPTGMKAPAFMYAPLIITLNIPRSAPH